MAMPRVGQKPKPKQPPRCPRCGYDQTGEVARWSESCPLEGVCSECGQAFEWVRSFHPHRADIRWLPDHAAGFWSLLARCCRVIPRAATPPRFWRRVGIDAAFSPVAWLVFLMFWPVALRLGSISAYLLAHELFWRGQIRLGRATVAGISRQRDELIQAALTSPGLTQGEFRAGEGPALLATALTSMVVIPAMFLVLPWTRRQAKLRAAHIVRAAVYSTVCLLPLLLLELGITGIGLGAALNGRLVSNWRGGGLDQAFQTLVGVYQSWTLALLTLAWVLWWWHEAIVRGWNIHRGGTIWSLLTVCAVLASVVVLSLTSRELLYLIIRLGGV